MVFGFFARRSSQAQLPECELGVESGDIVNEGRAFAAQQLRTPSPSVESMSVNMSAKKPTFVAEPESFTSQDQDIPPNPPETPSPPPPAPDPSALYDLIASVPAKIFHSYALQHLSEPHLVDLGHESLSALESFFATLTPPPLLHCVRCHNNYCEVDNTDRSCLIAHDDESAEIERAGKSMYNGSNYVTHYGCCAKTVEGEGDMGPPDGWCYEGRHTTDAKRARFRADSTPQDDRLVSCADRKCFEPKTPKLRRRRSRKSSIKPESKAFSESSSPKRKRADSSARSASPAKSTLLLSPSRNQVTVVVETPQSKIRPRRSESEIVEDSEAEAMNVDSPKEKGKATSKATPKATPKSKSTAASKPLSTARSTSSLKPTSKRTRKTSTLEAVINSQQDNDTPSPRKKRKSD